MTNSKKGLLALLLPLVALIAIFIVRIFTSSVLSYLLLSTPLDPSTGGLMPTSPIIVLGQIVNVLLGLLGMLAVLSTPVCLGFAIYFFTRKDPGHDLTLLQHPAYAGLLSEQVNYIDKWSWTAFFAAPVWAVGNKLYGWTLLCFVPLAGFYAWIKLSADGRKMAWEKGGWDNFAQFQSRQKIMMWVAVGICVTLIALKVILVRSMPKEDPGYLSYPSKFMLDN